MLLDQQHSLQETFVTNTDFDFTVSTACQETKEEDIKTWVSRCSSRLWRGANAKGVWTKMNNGEGAWRPKKIVKAGKTGRVAAARPAKRRATTDSGKSLSSLMCLFFAVPLMFLQCALAKLVNGLCLANTAQINSNY